MDGVAEELGLRFPDIEMRVQPTADETTTLWVPPDRLTEVLAYLKDENPTPYPMLFDLFGIDERVRGNRPEQADGDFTVVYQLLSCERSADLRIKVALKSDGPPPSVPTVSGLWPAADWYERELWDMYGIKVEGHPRLHRILMPPWWEGHPLRKDHHDRATEFGPFYLPPDKSTEYQEALRFRPEQWGLPEETSDSRLTYLNVGPQHPGTHGPFRIVLLLRDERILAAVPDIGYHHRGNEKIGERQTWHTFIPYTDRVDYLGGVNNEFPYVLAVEKLAGVEVPPRAQMIRVMMAELFRISSHLVWYGTFAQDLGAISPVFYMFSDRERLFDIVAAVTGARMHPSWFRIGGVAQDLPVGWETLVGDFLRYLPARLREYERLVMDSRIVKARTRGIGSITLKEAIEWGVTGPNLRACGSDWDLRKKRPYSGYGDLEFEVATADGGDCYARAQVRVEEIRQSLKIVQQCLDNMPAGPYLSSHPVASPPLKERTMHDIETLIAHFLNVSWGPVVPPGEAMVTTEATKGNNGYYLVSDGGTGSYRTRIRTPSFPHLQALPLLCTGLEVPDLIAILGSLDFVMGDVDR